MNWLNFPEDLDQVPNVEGVYALATYNSESGIVYIGKADDLKQRLSQHPDPNNPCLRRNSIQYFSYEVTNNSEYREEELINKYNPECNRTQ